jgi:hypothetical protein
MLAKMLTCAMEASFHHGDTGVESFSNLGMAAPFLNQREQRAILRTQLSQRVPQRIEFLGIHRPRRLWNIFVFLAERQKNPPQLLPPELIDARVSREAEQPRLELRRCLQTIDGSNHLDEHLLRQVLDVITSASHSINEAGHTMLVTDNELPLGGFVALLGSPHEVGQRIR